MDFFSGFGRRVSKTAKIVGEKTRESVDANRINGEIRARKAEIDKLYQAYGEICYRENVRGAAAPERTDLEGRITGKLEEIAALNAQLDELRKIVRCPQCGMELSKEIRFCGQCGARLPEPEPEPEPVAEQAEEKARLAFCTECGAPRMAGIRFCTSCGSDFERMEAQANAAKPDDAESPQLDQADPLNDTAEPSESDAPDPTDALPLNPEPEEAVRTPATESDAQADGASADEASQEKAD